MPRSTHQPGQPSAAHRTARALRLTAPLLCVALCFTVTESGKKKKQRELALAEPDRCYTVHVDDGVAYLGQTSGLATVDISDASRPDQIGGLMLHATVHAVAVDPPWAYLAVGSRGLIIVDVSDPTRPKAIQRFETPGKARDVVVRDGVAYVADGREGVRLVDVSDPERPLPLAWISTRHEVRSLALLELTLLAGAMTARFEYEAPEGPPPREVFSFTMTPSRTRLRLRSLT